MHSFAATRLVPNRVCSNIANFHQLAVQCFFFIVLSVRLIWHLITSWTVSRGAFDARVAGTPLLRSAQRTSYSRPRRVAGDTAGVRGNQRPRKTRKQWDADPAAPRSARPRPARRALLQSLRRRRLPPPPPQSAPSRRGDTRQVRPPIREQALRAFEAPARHLQSPLIPLLACAYPHFSFQSCTSVRELLQSRPQNVNSASVESPTLALSGGDIARPRPPRRSCARASYLRQQSPYPPPPPRRAKAAPAQLIHWRAVVHTGTLYW